MGTEHQIRVWNHNRPEIEGGRRHGRSPSYVLLPRASEHRSSLKSFPITSWRALQTPHERQAPENPPFGVASCCHGEVKPQGFGERSRRLACTAGFIREYAYRLLSGRDAGQLCSGHWSNLNRQRISGGISCTRSLGVEAGQLEPAWVTRWR